jgi:hypothetical protein
VIKPKPKPSQAPSRAMATVLTTALMLGAWVGLKELAVPAFASSGDVIRELDPLVFERYAAPPAPEQTSAPSEAEEAPAAEAEEPAEVTSFDEEVGAAVEQLGRMFTTEEAPPPTSDRSTVANEPGTPGIAEDVSEERFEALFGPGEGPDVGGAAARRSGRPGAGREGVGLGITERPAGEGGGPDEDRGAAGDPSDVAPDLGALTETRRTATAESEVEIGEFEPESFDGTAADRLATWMRGHESPLPVGVRAHVNFQPSFLTSAVDITAEGREWELYLMFNQSLRELHIVLVEGNRSIYMIDRGFQEESRSLREGTVRRSDGEIVAVSSRTASASSERAQDFYNVFLSWWNSVKDDVGSS